MEAGLCCSSWRRWGKETAGDVPMSRSVRAASSCRAGWLQSVPSQDRGAIWEQTGPEQPTRLSRGGGKVLWRAASPRTRPSWDSSCWGQPGWGGGGISSPRVPSAGPCPASSALQLVTCSFGTCLLLVSPLTPALWGFCRVWPGSAWRTQILGREGEASSCCHRSCSSVTPCCRRRKVRAALCPALAAGRLGALRVCPALSKRVALAPWQLCVHLSRVRVQGGHGASRCSLCATLPTRFGPGSAAGAPGSAWVSRTRACSAPRGRPRGHICTSGSPRGDSLQESHRSRSRSRRSPRAARVGSGGPLWPGEEGRPA